jgi:hypothetical protein
VEVPKEQAGIHEKETYASPSSTSASSSPPASAKSSSSMSDMLIQGESGQGRLQAVCVCELRWWSWWCRGKGVDEASDDTEVMARRVNVGC